MGWYLNCERGSGRTVRRMTLAEDIEFWRKAAVKAKLHGSALLYIGIAIGLKMSKQRHQAEARAQEEA